MKRSLEDCLMGIESNGKYIELLYYTGVLNLDVTGNVYTSGLFRNSSMDAESCTCFGYTHEETVVYFWKEINEKIIRERGQ